MYILVYIYSADPTAVPAQVPGQLLAVSRLVREKPFAFSSYLPISLLTLSRVPSDSTIVLYYTLLGLLRPGSGAGNHLVIGFHAVFLYHGTP